MGLPVEVNNLMLGSLGGYTVGRSLRFRSSASAYLSRTPSVTGNQKKWTWSAWVKRGSLTNGYLMTAPNNSGPNDGTVGLYFESNQLFTYYDTSGTNPAGAVGPAVFRDTSAWYHIVWAVDAVNTIHYVYVNGVLVSTDTSKYPPNYAYSMNQAGYLQTMGTQAWGLATFFDGYMAEVNFIDGQALTPSSFGAYDTNGVWQPKKYSGTYGTNGFYLNFSDNSAATAAAIGKDSSGNGNNWTPNNIDMTSNNYRSFTTGTYGWTAPAGVTSVNYLIVAGGGGGGNDGGGGGGAGGVLTGTATVTPGTTYSITVGAGGAAATNGSNSVMSGTGFTTLTAIGGGKGGSGLSAGSAGGSGGGGGRSSGGSGGVGQAGGAGTAGQGNNGGAGYLHVNGAGGGGGGAGSAGTNATNTDQFAGNGGAGIASTITGSTVYYGGGGGGGAGNVGASNGTGGIGGGGNGGGATGGAGTANTGGGGGGGQFGGTGGAGGSGIIILSYSGALQAGTTYDSMIDSPTVSASSSNYAVMNPNFVTPSTTFSNGNLTLTKTAAVDVMAVSTIAMPSSKWYWEITVTSLSASSNLVIGIVKNTQTNGTYSNTLAVLWNGNGNATRYGTSLGAVGTTFATNDVLGIALDMDSGTVSLYKNNIFIGTITGVDTTIPHYAFWDSYANGESASLNFGQRPFAYTPPSGFKALNTYNLPASSIANGAQHFGVNLYTGTGATQSIVNSGSFRPDLIWGKQRNGASSHVLTDSVRGTNSQLSSNLTNAQDTQTDVVTAFNSNGFTVGASAGFNMNQSGSTLVAWQWKAGGTGVTNTAGTITSTVSANPSAGFSIVTYTGTGSGSPTIGHGLGVAPSMIIVKSRSNVVNWGVGHVSAGWANAGLLNGTNAFGGSTYFASTAPTSTVFSVQDATVTNISGATYVAYCFSAVSGYSAFGKYTGNGSTDGPFIYTGFRPRFILVKRTDTVESWNIVDTSRNPTNQAGANLYPDLTNAESNNNLCDILSNGFKLRNTWTGANTSGGTYIYAAFAENPFNISRAR